MQEGRVIKLIIAEKPELGRAIAGAIDGMQSVAKGGIAKGEYIVTWAFGHLLTLQVPEDVDAKYKTWALNDLPIYFPDWGQKPSASTGGNNMKEERLAQIGELLKKAECVIHAGDPDDEGQYLIDEILRWHGYKGKVYRMNTNDTTPAALKNALNNLTDNKLHEPYGWSAHARSVADLLVGCNCSRYFTLNNPEVKTLTVGRVQTSTLGLVVLRDEAIEGHVKQKYYEINVNTNIEGIEIGMKYIPDKDSEYLTDGRILDKATADKISSEIMALKTADVKVQKKPEDVYAPLPFNLTELQSYCSTKFGYDPSKVLAITQTLRDKHSAITYNRSDCRYITTEQFKTIDKTIDTVVSNIHYRPKELTTSRVPDCVNDSKVTAHTAIIPQNKTVDLSQFTVEEKNVYLAICKYFLAQFMPPAKKRITQAVAVLPDKGKLSATGTEILSEGYLALFKNDKDAQEETKQPVCALSEGNHKADIIKAETVERETKALPRYTKATLAKDMTRIAKYVTNPEVKKLLLAKDKGKEGENGSIGTVATRGPIIDALVDRGFIKEDKNHIISTQLGRELYRILPDELKKPDMTAYWWSIQEDIQKDGRDWHDLPRSVFDLVSRVVQTKYPSVDLSKIPDNLKRGRTSSAAEPVGVCPACGAPVIEGKMGYGCSRYKEGCKFVLWKKAKAPLMSQIAVSRAMATKLLKGWTDVDGEKVGTGSIHSKKLYSSKSSKCFEGDVRLTYNAGAQYPLNYKLEFTNKKAAKH